jgi:hypothetical protein
MVHTVPFTEARLGAVRSQPRPPGSGRPAVRRPLPASGMQPRSTRASVSAPPASSRGDDAFQPSPAPRARGNGAPGTLRQCPCRGRQAVDVADVRGARDTNTSRSAPEPMRPAGTAAGHARPEPPFSNSRSCPCTRRRFRSLSPRGRPSSFSRPRKGQRGASADFQPPAIFRRAGASRVRDFRRGARRRKSSQQFPAAGEAALLYILESVPQTGQVFIPAVFPSFLDSGRVERSFAREAARSPFLVESPFLRAFRAEPDFGPFVGL